MNLDRRLRALESAVTLSRNGKTYDMSMLSLEQLLLIERAVKSGAEMDGTTYLDVSDFTAHETTELEKALRQSGVLCNGERLK